MARTAFKSILRNTEKKGAPSARTVKPWETSQPDCVAVHEHENAESKGASPFTESGDETTDNNNRNRASDVRCPQASKALDGPSVARASQADKPFEVYPDTLVCSYLGIRRRVLNDARTMARRGKDWECVGDHAGMSKAWIDRFALDKGIRPRFEVILDPIRENDGVTSVRIVGAHPNPCVVVVERLSDGKRMFARVRNLLQHPMHLRDCFDAVMNNGNLEWFEKGNSMRY